jgi:zinc finger FYVE domain-containing protein 26
MKLAITVATKCNIECDQVWAAWGMSLLKLGRYSEAKEKFNYCLSMLNPFC